MSRGRWRAASAGKRPAIEATVECDGVAKPVSVAEILVLTPT